MKYFDAHTHLNFAAYKGEEDLNGITTFVLTAFPKVERKPGDDQEK